MSAASYNQVPERAVVLGRDLELSTIGRFLTEDETTSCLVLVGDAGIGKTTLWEAAIADAPSYAVVSSRCSQSVTWTGTTGPAGATIVVP